ncbi:MAG: motility-associated protein, partial [Syntrophales bacterium]
MIAIIGFIVVTGAIAGGYLMEHGNLYVLLQPAEVVIIFGAAFGAFLVASPMKVIKSTSGSVLKIFTHEITCVYLPEVAEGSTLPNISFDFILVTCDSR